MNEIRTIFLKADNAVIAAGYRVRVRGSGNMTLLPDFYVVDIWNLPNEDLAVIRTSRMLSAYGTGNSMICYGEIDDVYSRQDGVNVITSISVIDGKTFWNSRADQTVGGGAGFRDALDQIMKGASLGPYLARDGVLPRGQTFSGRLAESVSMIAKSVSARAFLTKNVVFIVTMGMASDIIDISESDIVSEASFADAVVMLKTIVKGYPIGVMARKNGRLYRLVSQKVDADNFKGNWQSEIVLVDEEKVGSAGMEGG